jgi:hypothetical protein
MSWVQVHHIARGSYPAFLCQLLKDRLQLCKSHACALPQVASLHLAMIGLTYRTTATRNAANLYFSSEGIYLSSYNTFP